MMKSIGIFLVLLSCGLTAFAQDVSSGFEWTSSTGSLTSSASFFACESTITVTLTTSLNHVHTSGSRVLIPQDTGNDDEQIEITLTFSEPVTNLSVHVHDIDSTWYGGSPAAEFLSDLNPYPTSVTGEIFDTGITVDSGTLDNVGGWLNYENQEVNSVSFIYNRPPFADAGLFLDSLQFNCKGEDVVGLNNPLYAFENSGLLVFPNPVNDQLTVEVDSPCTSGTFVITTLEGKEVQHLPYNGEARKNVDVSDFAPGHYTIRLLNCDESQQLNRFVISR